jgi:N-acyl-phosphatidylethanolamine-hydrolysing phospholipase D
MLLNGWASIAIGFWVILLGFPWVSSGEDGDLETLSRQKAHHRNSQFINPWIAENQPGGLFHFLKWKFKSNPYKTEKQNPPNIPITRPNISQIMNKGDSLTYLGHATYWIRIQGHNLLTDPVFENIGFFIRRHTPFPLPLNELPPPEVVLISHSHYDHLNADSIRSLGPGPLFLTPLGYKDWFNEVLPKARVIELDWFESFSYKGMTYRFLPAQHWTKRSLWDTNKRLWGSWLIEGGGRRVFFAGDTGYFLGFKEFGKKFGPMDAALLPIGGYEPRWFMEKYHQSPEEAIQAFLDLKSKVLLPSHWGVFDLTDEPLELPPKALQKASGGFNLIEGQVSVVPPGGTWFFP